MMKRLRNRWVHTIFLLGSVCGAASACASENDDLDSESHFACQKNSDCPTVTGTTRCIAGQCVTPESDPTDPLSTTTPDCSAGTCSGAFANLVSIPFPEGLLYTNINAYPLLSVETTGEVKLFTHQTPPDFGGPYEIVLKQLSAGLDEHWTRTIQAFELASEPGQLPAAYVYSQGEGFAVVEDIHDFDRGIEVVRLSALDGTGMLTANHMFELSASARFVDASPAGTLTLVGNHVFSGSDVPIHPDCPEVDALVVQSADGSATALRCFRGVTFTGLEATPAGYSLHGVVEGEAPGVREIDIGEGLVEADEGSIFLARYDRNWAPVWFRTYKQSVGSLIPASGGGGWMTISGGSDNTWLGDLVLPPDPYGVRDDLVYLNERGIPTAVNAREGESIIRVQVDGAGNAVVYACEQPGPEGQPGDYCEIRKVLRDGDVAWRIPIAVIPMLEDIAVGPNGDVYLAVIISSTDTLTVGTESVTGPGLFVFRFLP